MKRLTLDFFSCELIAADKLLHFSFKFIFAYITVFFAEMFIYSKENVIFFTIVFSFLLSLFKEVFDKFFRKAEFCWYDILAGMLGAGFFLLFYFFENP